MNKISKHSSIIIVALLFVAVYLLLAVGCHEYLRRIEALSLFVGAPLFMDDFWRTPGGPLELAARWLTQLFYHPWLGAAVYALLLAGIQWLGCRAFRLRGWWQLFFLIVPLWLLLSMLSMGYLIFGTKSPAFAMQCALGVLIALSAAVGFELRGNKVALRKTTNQPLSLTGFHLVARALYLVIATFVYYYLMGFFGLLAMACYIIANWRDWVGSLATAAAIVAAPWVVCSITTGNLHPDDRYTAGLPRTDLPQWRLWTASSPIALSDENFRTTLSLERAIDEGRWAEAADIAASQKGEPTRLNVVLGDIALMRTGQAADRMFTFPIGSAPYNSPTPESTLHEAGAVPLWYNMGETNLAYRWAMEYAVERGFSVEGLKYLTKCALINGEYHLADKYLDILSMTMNHRAWAKHYRQYVSDPSKMSQDPEFDALEKIQTMDNMLSTDEGRLEGFMWPLLQQQSPYSIQQLEISMLADLVMHDLDLFMTKVPSYMQLADRLPRHFQEAILMWSARNANDEYTKYPIDPVVKERFSHFVQINNQTKDLAPEARIAALAPYAGTYWYYLTAYPHLRIL